MPINSQDLDYYEEMGKAPADFTTVATSQYDYSIMHYTSGTTGKPKGAVHRHQAVVQQYATGKWVLDLHEEDIYWCTADPGWVTGTSYGMLAPVDKRRDAAHLRRWIQRTRLVRADPEAQRDSVVHGADCNSDAHEGWETRFPSASIYLHLDSRPVSASP